MSVPNSFRTAFSGIRESGVPVDGVGRAEMNGWISATSSSVIDFGYNLRRHSIPPRSICSPSRPHDIRGMIAGMDDKKQLSQPNGLPQREQLAEAVLLALAICGAAVNGESAKFAKAIADVMIWSAKHAIHTAVHSPDRAEDQE